MTNQERLLYIEKCYGAIYGITQAHCIKIVGQGWFIKLVHKGLIELNGGSNEVRGAYPSGLHEALIVVNRLVKRYELLQEIKKQQATNKPVTTNKQVTTASK